MSHYDVDLSYNVETGRLAGSTTVSARLTQNLSRFNLDFALPVSSVTVNGEAATFETQTSEAYYGLELVVTPAAGLPLGSRMTVVVSSSAKPREVKLHHYSQATRTITGITIWNDPEPASEWWYPSNAYPSDKATYDVTLTADKPNQAITNGMLLSRAVHGSNATSHWRSTAPVSS